MSLNLKHASFLGLGGLVLGGIGQGAQAADLAISVEIPSLKVAEYHKPYVSAWIEKADGTHVGNLWVWYDLKMREGGGQKWLKDMRSFWRKSGRDLSFPVDGLSSATRAPGRQELSFSGSKSPISALSAGSYALVVEAAREVGDRDQVRIPFDFDPKAAKASSVIKAKGTSELGEISLQVRPSR